MTVRQFLAIRRSQRLAKRADRAMAAAYGLAWERNKTGVVDLLSSPAPVIVLDPAQLDEVVRRAVAEALADSVPTEQEQEAPVEAWPELEQLAEPEQPIVEQPRDTSIFAEPVGNGTPPAQPVQPATSADEKRREFVRSFLAEERAARGLIPN